MAFSGGAAAAGGLAFINMSTFVSGLTAAPLRVWADTTFGRGSGLYALACSTLLGAILIVGLGLFGQPPKLTPQR